MANLAHGSGIKSEISSRGVSIEGLSTRFFNFVLCVCLLLLTALPSLLIAGPALGASNPVSVPPGATLFDAIAVTTTLTSAPNPSVLSQTVTFTATVNQPGGNTPVSIVDFAFAPKVITIPVGSSVTWTNNGNATHTSTSTGGVWDSGDITHGQSFTQIFTQTGSYNYFCMHHPGIMTGTINVIAAATTPTGSVTFKDGGTQLATVNLSGNQATYTTASLSAGSHNITAVYNGDANFAASISNVLTQVVNPVTPASISVASGGGQSTPINTAFLSPLTAIVRDLNGNPLAGIVVTFTAPGSGASGTFAGGSLTATATTNAQGLAASPTFTANGTVGSYNVLATVAGVATPATFGLLNTPPGSASGYTYYLPFLANNYQPNGASGGSFTTYFVFQNPNSTTANINLRYFDTNGNSVSLPAGTCATVAAYSECIAPNPFASNVKGEGILVADQPLSLIVAEGTPYGGSAYAVGAGASSSLIAPVIIRGGLADFVTQLSIFNGGSTTATGTVKFYQQDGTYISGADKQLNLAPHTTTIFDQTGDTMLGNNFYGWAQITGNGGSQLAAQVLEQRPSTRFVAIANAQAIPRTLLFAPAIFNGAFNGFVTGINFVNPNPSAVTVNVTYYRNDGTAFPAPAFTVPAYGVVGVFERGTGGPGLPTGGLSQGFYGSAIVTTNGGGIAMLINEQGGLTPGGTAQSGTYAAASSGATSVGLPVIDNGAFGGYITGATILNTTNAMVGGTIQYYDLSGTATGTAKPFSIGPYASYPVFQGDPAQGLSPGFAGTAIVTVTSGPTSSLLTTTNAQSDNFFYTYTEPNQ